MVAARRHHSRLKAMRMDGTAALTPAQSERFVWVDARDALAGFIVGGEPDANEPRPVVPEEAATLMTLEATALKLCPSRPHVMKRIDENRFADVT